MDHLVIRRSKSNPVAAYEGIKLGLSIAADKETELKIICATFHQAATSSVLREAMGEDKFNCLNRNRKCKIKGIETSLETIQTIKKSGALFDGVCVYMWPSESKIEQFLLDVELCQAVILVEWVPGKLDGYIERNKAKLIEV